MSNKDSHLYSYSKIDTFLKCPYKFKLKYEQNKKVDVKTLALELGSIAHKGKELVSLAIISGKKPDYDNIIDKIKYGCYDETEENSFTLAGIEELKSKYFFDWIAPEDITYDEKIQTYFDGLQSQEDSEWQPVVVEQYFNFSYDGTNILHGFIDKIERNNKGELRVVDYKSSKKVYRQEDLATPLQMVIYDLAIQQLYNKIPIEHIYDFIFLGEKQSACTKGYLNRGHAKLKKTFEKIEKCRKTNDYAPKPSPLCHWCEYCATNTLAPKKHKHECSYYSLWTPDNKVYTTNKPYNNEVENAADEFIF